MEMAKETFAKFLKRKREELGLSQTSMASEMQIGLRNYQYLEKGREDGGSDPSFDTLMALVYKLKFDPGEIFGMPYSQNILELKKENKDLKERLDKIISAIRPPKVQKFARSRR